MTNIFEFAPKVTQLLGVTAGNTATLESGEPVRIWGYVVSQGLSNSLITIRTNGTNTTLFTHNMVANSTHVIDIKFIADDGLQVVFADDGGDAGNARITLLHNHPGS